MPETRLAQMHLTNKDFDNMEQIHSALKTESVAQVVSFALNLYRFVIDELAEKPGTELLMRSPDGKVIKVVAEELYSLFG